MIILTGLLFSVVIVIYNGLITGIGVQYLDFPSFLLIAAPAVFILTITKAYRSIGNYIKNSFKKDYRFSKAELEALSRDLSSLSKIVLASGAFAFLSGIISLLQQLSDPAAIGPSVAFSIMSPFYAIIISFFVLYPTKVWAEQKLHEK